MKKINRVLGGFLVGLFVFFGVMSFAGFVGTSVYAEDEDCSVFTGPAKEDCEARNAAGGGGGGGGGGGSAVTSACEGVESLGVKCDASGSAQDVIDGPIKTLINLLSYVVGIASVVMIIYGGFRFITSGGNSDATKSARNTILYALVGLFIVLTVQILINFVFGQANNINNPPATPPGDSGPPDPEPGT